MPGHVAARESLIDKQCKRVVQFNSFFASHVKRGGPNYIATDLLEYALGKKGYYVIF